MTKKILSQYLQKVLLFVLLWGPTAETAKNILGKRLHQKLIMAPRIGYWPQIKQPRSFNEKVMHRKLFTDSSQFEIVSDKYGVRNFVQSHVGEEILNKVYYVTDDPETIPFEELPNEFVIKPTHGSGWITVVDNKEQKDIEKIRTKCSEYLSEKYGGIKGEYWYCGIKPRLLIEERLKDEDGNTPPDYKFFVFHGDVKYIQVDYDRFSDHTRRFYDRNWNPLEFELKFPLGPVTEKPSTLSKMITISETLGNEFDFVRVDLYEINDEKVVFGELTVAPGSGGERFRPIKYDFEFGRHW